MESYDFEFLATPRHCTCGRNRENEDGTSVGLLNSRQDYGEILFYFFKTGGIPSSYDV